MVLIPWEHAPGFLRHHFLGRASCSRMLRTVLQTGTGSTALLPGLVAVTYRVSSEQQKLSVWFFAAALSQNRRWMGARNSALRLSGSLDPILLRQSARPVVSGSAGAHKRLLGQEESGLSHWIKAQPGRSRHGWLERQRKNSSAE